MRGLLLATFDIQACSYYVLRAAPLDELVLHRQLEVVVCRVYMGAVETEHGGKLRDAVAPILQRDSLGVAPEPMVIRGGPKGKHLSPICIHKLAHNTTATCRGGNKKGKEVDKREREREGREREREREKREEKREKREERREERDREKRRERGEERNERNKKGREREREREKERKVSKKTSK